MILVYKWNWCISLQALDKRIIKLDIVKPIIAINKVIEINFLKGDYNDAGTVYTKTHRDILKKIRVLKRNIKVDECPVYSY